MNNEDSLSNNASSELNFIDQWSNITVLKEISKGTILRKQKLKQSTYKGACDTVNYNYDEPSTSRSNQMHYVFRKPVCIKTRKKIRRKSPKRCSMRIAELAVPTKRQCLDTWRSKATVIPNFMVERLKQRVLDQKPIVLISDAVNCFETRKRKPRKRIKKAHSIAENTRMLEHKILCAIFGYKVALNLSRPMNLSLNYRLSKINNIVREEMDTMLRYKKTSYQKEIRNKELLEEISRKVTVWIDTILEESECTLLEDNLLELEEEIGPVLDIIDDLVDEVMVKCVPPILVTSRETLYKDDSISDLSKDRSTEEIITDLPEGNVYQMMTELYKNALEGAERQISDNRDGIISDIEQPEDLLSIGTDSDHVLENVRGELDKLVDKIIDNVIPVDNQFQNEIYITNGEEVIQTSFELEQGANNLLKTSQESVLEEHNDNVNEDINITIQSETSNIALVHKKDEIVINDLMNEKIKDSEIIKQIINDLLKTVWNSEQIVLDDSKPNDTEVIIKQESLEIEKQLNEKEDLQNEVVKDSESKLTGQEDISLSAKISETKVIVQELLNVIIENLLLALDETEPNEDNKKVKFSAIDMGIEVKKKLLTKLSAQQLILQKPSSDYLNLNIDFAPPNEHLLSNADESWPQNIALPIIKVTESVNKSVTSLGNIFEIDEKRISSESSYVSTNSEMLLDVQLTSMSMGNSKMNDVLLAQFQNENEIIVGTEGTNKKGHDRPQRKAIDKKKQVKNQRNVSETKYDPKSGGTDKNRSKDLNERSRNGSVEVSKKPEKKYIKPIIDKEKPRKHSRLSNENKITNKIKVSDKGIDVKNKIIVNKTAIKQKKLMKPEVDVKKEELIKDPLEIISKEDRGDGLKNEQKPVTYSCEKFFSEKTKLKDGMMKIDAYDISRWCKGLENVIENLEMWNSWMNSTCRCISYLKQKGSYNCLKSIEKSKRKWKTLDRNIKQDTILWRDMKQRNRDGLKSYKKYYHDTKSVATKHQVCDCSNK